MAEKPRIAFLGAGWIAQRRLTSLLNANEVNVVAVADTDPHALESTRCIAPDAKAVSSLDDLLALEPDGIVISTPNAQHARQACRALEAGAAVFCQKPVGRTHIETLRVIEAARRADRLLETDFCYRSLAGARQIRDFLLAGAIGELLTMELWFHNSYGPDKAWCYDFEQAGGGCLLDLGVHLLDLACWLQGGAAISAGSARLYLREGRYRDHSIEELAAATIDFANGVRAFISCSWRQALNGPASIGARLLGARGTLRLTNIDGSFFDFNASFLDQIGISRNLAGPPDDWEGRTIAGWVRSLIHNRRFSSRAYEILSVSKAVDLLYQSSSRRIGQ